MVTGSVGKIVLMDLPRIFTIHTSPGEFISIPCTLMVGEKREREQAASVYLQRRQAGAAGIKYVRVERERINVKSSSVNPPNNALSIARINTDSGGVVAVPKS